MRGTAQLLLLATTIVAAVGMPAVLTADPGYYSGTPEGIYILKNMTQTRNVTQSVMFCAEVIEGQLSGQAMVLVTTGIGHDSAGICMASLLAYYDNTTGISSVVYMGTSGWSPRVGGFFDPAADPACETLPATVEDNLIGVGDVCVSPVSFLYNCGFCNWNDASNGECAAPKCTGRNQSSVFGVCEFYTGDLTLTQELLAAANQTDFGPRPAALRNYSTLYWEAVWNGLEVISTAQPPALPRVYDQTQCGEAAGYNIWKGLPQEYRCRASLSEVITNGFGVPVAPGETVCVSAMEGPGWMRVLLGWKTKVPFVGVRAASNYNMWPLKKGNATVLANTAFLSQADQDEFSKLGYQYAIQSSSAVVLTYFKGLAQK
ncbi:hypothetical protein DIPPA_34650 [Diplonema papillatum]|nr:hypothetical protein DIPPA_34650 [Diplonema papillatum]|eukprot:gene6415-9817_t